MRCAAFAVLTREYGSSALEISSQCLFALDRLEERLEVACAEALGSLALNDLVENGWPVFDRLRENLKQVSFIVPVDENPELLKRREIFIDFADSRGNVIVIRCRNLQEFNTARLEISHRRDDVV